MQAQQANKHLQRKWWIKGQCFLQPYLRINNFNWLIIQVTDLKHAQRKAELVQPNTNVTWHMTMLMSGLEF